MAGSDGVVRSVEVNCHRAPHFSIGKRCTSRSAFTRRDDRRMVRRQAASVGPCRLCVRRCPHPGGPPIALPRCGAGRVGRRRPSRENPATRRGRGFPRPPERSPSFGSDRHSSVRAFPGFPQVRARTARRMSQEPSEFRKLAVRREAGRAARPGRRPIAGRRWPATWKGPRQAWTVSN